MADALRIDRYLERTECGVEGAPSLDLLARLLRAHMRHIPFENLDVLLGRPVQLDLDSLQRKLVDARRGGYCFEHATLFAAVLARLGFRCRMHSARVTVMAPRTEMPRTHMFVTVDLPEGAFVADPGFGGLAPLVPVRLDAESTLDETAAHWIAKEGDYWTLRTRTAAKTVDCWVTTLEEDYPADFLMANHYVSTHPASAFVNRIMLKAIGDGQSVSVMNREVTVRRGGEEVAMRLADRAALRNLLLEHFGFDLPEVAELRVPAIPEWT